MAIDEDCNYVHHDFGRVGDPSVWAAMIVLDRGQDPGVQGALNALNTAGAEGWLAYVGGRSLFFAPWSAGTVQGLVDAIAQVLPVYALATPLTSGQGSADAATAVAAVNAWERPFDNIMLDVEPSYYSANPGGTLAYISSWVAGVHHSGMQATVYGTGSTISGVYAANIAPDFVLVANYPYPAGVLWGPPDPAHIFGFPDGIFPGRRGWQYANEVVFAGLNCDISTTQFKLLGGLGGPSDDMFTDADRAMLQSLVASVTNKLSPFLVPAGKTVWISGPDQNTLWNVCPQDKAVTLQVFAYTVDGSVIGAVTPRLVANDPGKRGPVPGYGRAADLGVTGSCTLGFVNNGPGDVWVTVH